MTHKIRILYAIPNFDTAGSGIPLLKIAKKLDKNCFEPHIACLHDRGDLFQEVIKSDKTIIKYDVGYFLTGMYRNGQSSVDLSA